MSNGRPIRLPAGLPACLISQDDSFATLCKLLEIDSRKRRGHLVDQPGVRRFLRQRRPLKTTRKHKTSLSLRIRQEIADFYSSPDERRSVWQSFFKETSGFQETPANGHVPSLEYLALRKYEQEFANAVVDENELADCGAVVKLESEYPDWRAPALAALPSIRTDITNWQSLPPERQRDTLLAAFAVATLLDDARLLLWAAEENLDISKEFGFAVRKNDPPQAVGEQVGEYTNEDGGETKHPTSDASGALEQACQKLSSAALELGQGPPSGALFERVTECAEDVARLRDAVLKAAAANNLDSLIAGFSGFLKDQTHRVPWLSAEADAIESLWRDTYSSAGNEKIRKLQADIERGKRDTTSRLEEWVTRSAELAEANDLLRACQDELAIASDVASRLKASEQEDHCLQAARSANRRATDAMLRVLEAASPSGTTDAVQRVSTSTTERDKETGDSSGLPEPLETAESLGTPTNEKEAVAKTEIVEPGPTQAAERSEDPKSDVIPEDDHADRKEAIAQSPDPNETGGVTEAAGTSDSKSVDARGRSLDSNELAIWHALREGRTGLGYQIALLRSKLEANGVFRPDPELLAAVALGGCLSGPDGDVAYQFRRHAAAVLADQPFGGVEAEIKDALNLLLLSASLRPALFAPQSGAILMLQRVELSGELSAVYRLAEAVAERAQRLQGVHFDISRLSSILDATVWESQLEEHTDKVKDWRVSAGTERFLFGPARKVWKHWLTKGGILFELAGLITGDGQKPMPRVREIIAKLEDNKSFAQLVEDTYRNKLGHKAGDSISGRALTQLAGDVEKVIELAGDWLRIVESKPTSEGFVENTVAELRSDIEKFAPQALTAIGGVQGRVPGAELTAALVRAQDSVESLSRMFSHDRDFSEAENAWDPRRLLTRDILFVAEQDIGPDGGIDEDCPPGDALALLTDTGSHRKSLFDAFEVRLGRGDIAGAEAVCEQMGYEGDPQEDSCRNRLAPVFTDKRRELERELDESSEKLEQAFKMGEVSETKLNVLNASIASAQELLSRKESVVAAARAVSGFRGRIEGYFDQAIERMRLRFEPYLPLENDRERAFVEHAFDTEDLLTLHEQLDRLESGDSLLPREPENRVPLRKFLSDVSKIEEYLIGNAAPTPNALIGSMSKSEDAFGLSFSSLDESQTKRSTKLLKRWYEVARGGTADSGKIHGLMECLGFAVRHCNPSGANRIAASVEPLRSRELCPIHTYGSSANGHYEIVLNWRSPPQEAIVQSVGEIRNRCVIVFHFGRLSHNEREWLRGWSIDNRTPFIVADESIVLHLASLQTRTLRAFFDCTLPFTTAQPFFTAAGLVPPESFYGREKERQQVMDRWGSCFVYGGRQLGKTALLRSVEADFHEPESSKVAKWVDLKVHDIGIARGAENIWKTLWGVLQELGVVGSDERLPPGRDGQVDALTEAVSNWVSRDQDSRILLLLDEADAFLADDLQHDFRESTRLKGLMDQTGRKFKAVFSGTAQRSTNNGAGQSSARPLR